MCMGSMASLDFYFVGCCFGFMGQCGQSSFCYGYEIGFVFFYVFFLLGHFFGAVSGVILANGVFSCGVLSSFFEKIDFCLGKINLLNFLKKIGFVPYQQEANDILRARFRNKLCNLFNKLFGSTPNVIESEIPTTAESFIELV